MANVKLDYKKVHFVGIGGISMSGLAEILHSMGYCVTGSDRSFSNTTEHLIRLGIPVYIGHDGANVENDVDLIVYTAAVSMDNPELEAGRLRNIKTIDRASLLGMMTERFEKTTAISGTHGKTTTTSMISDILINAQRNPYVSIGGIMKSIKSNMRIGSGEYFVTEADEYFNSFLTLRPYVGVILNIEADHPDFFKSYEDIQNSFIKFAQNIKPGGHLVINASTSNISEIIHSAGCDTVTFGLERETADWYAENISFNTDGTPSFDIIHVGKKIGRVKLSQIGRHNMINALAAAAACYCLGVSEEDIVNAMANLSGVKRRFEIKGTFRGVTVADDYAHHPTEVREALAAAKAAPYNNVYCVFQPHTYSRTKSLFKEFSEAFDNADKIIILDIFSARPSEEGNRLVHSRELVDEIKRRGKDAYYFPTFAEAENFLFDNCIPNDLLITMGAGDVTTLGDKILEKDLSTLSTELSTNV